MSQLASQHASQFSPPIQVLCLVQSRESVVVADTLCIWRLVQLLRRRLILLPQPVLPTDIQLAI